MKNVGLVSICVVALACAMSFAAPQKKAQRSEWVSQPAVTGDVPVVVFTFDDGIAEHYTTVAPILEKYGFRGTFNIVVDRVAKSDRKVTWDQLRDLDRRGHAIENHTLEHKRLVTLEERYNATNEIRRQIAQAQATLTREIGRAPKMMCAPYNATSPLIERLCREEGLVPMDCDRRNFGTGTPANTKMGVGAHIRRLVKAKRKIIDIMCHGVSEGGGGYRPFKTPEAFEAHVQEVKALVDKGLVRVDLYRNVVK